MKLRKHTTEIGCRHKSIYGRVNKQFGVVKEKRFFVQCSCGYKGPERRDPLKAQDDEVEHLEAEEE